MSHSLSGQRIAILATDGFEQVELTQPRQAVLDAGGEVHIVSPNSDDIQGMHHLDKGDTFAVDKTVADADPSQYHALLLPGGLANPDSLRQDADAVSFIRAFFDQSKPVAAICHAPWTLIEAGVVEGRTLTSWPSLQTDLRNAGAQWVDREVCVDQRLVTSRNPDDLDAFCDKLLSEFAASRSADAA